MIGVATALVEELPPRARRIHPVDHDRIFLRGTTSACAENTSVNVMYDFPWGNYLRVRGEYNPLIASRDSCEELPPRARRILPATISPDQIPGTTSACAENTLNLTHTQIQIRNYLRVRGEYSILFLIYSSSRELPPRARRILFVRGGGTFGIGTTSACAENTRKSCGKAGTKPELPPRARRIQTKGLGMGTVAGTTSACAENTHQQFPWPPNAWNYLRVRGEYVYRGGTSERPGELPPRARRILLFPGKCGRHPGTTSACAENT